MNRVIYALVAAMATSVACASTVPSDIAPVKVSIAKQAASIVPIPKFAIRVGGGNWNEFMVTGGVSVSFNVPLLPVPQLRVDAEVWGKPSNFGKDRRGNALSLLGVQTFMQGYAGVGPTYYFTDDFGDHKSGFGVKALGGLNLPDNSFVEAEIILGPKQPPVLFTFGRKF